MTILAIAKCQLPIEKAGTYVFKSAIGNRQLAMK
jgi:hypothetical protein